MGVFRKLKHKIKFWWIGFTLSLSSNSQTDPYVIRITNTSETESGTAKIFGYNLFAFKENFGSDKHIKVENLLSDSSGENDYFTILAETQRKTEFGMFRICMENANKTDKTIQLVHKSGWGKTHHAPVWLREYISPYQIQNSIIDLVKTFTATGGSYFSIPLDPKETMTIAFFPVKKENESRH